MGLYGNFDTSNTPPGEPVSGDSLTKYMRGSINATGAYTPQFIQQGGQQTGLGAGIVGQGVKAAQQGIGQVQQGMQTLQQPASFESGIMSGGQAQLASLLSPEVARINQGYQQKLNETAMLDGRGGGRNALMTQQSFAPLEQTNDLYNQQRQAAAQGLQGIGQAQAAAGGQIGGIAAQIGQMGSDQQRAGIAQQGLGLEANNQALQATLARRSQNLVESGQNKGLAGQLVGDLLGGFTSLYTKP